MPPVLEPKDGKQRAVTARSVGLGLAGVVLICGLTPYNDYALNNTFLVGNNLPLGVVMLTFLLTVCVNGPLSRWKPAWALSTGEVAVAFTMVLVSCALPSSGLMRYLPGALTGPLFHARDRGEYLAFLESLELPAWIFPSFAGETVREWANDPITWGFHERWTEDGGVPLGAWVRPGIAWGVFTFALYGALMCMVLIVRRQWFENERLAFPLAQIQLALVEQPPKGRWLSPLLSAKGFWIVAGAVFLLHAYNGLGNYFPRYVTKIPVFYNLHGLFSEPPWVFLDTKIKDCAVFFSVVGVTYFIPGAVAFSLWFFYILSNVHRMWLGTYMGDANNMPLQWSQHFGGLIAYTIVIFWVGRRHWRMVAAQAFRGRRADEPEGKYLSYPVAFWGLIGCAAIMVGWLILAGCTVFGAVVMVLLFLLLFLIITRIIGESGLIHGQLQVAITKPWMLLTISGWERPVPLETHFIGSTINATHYDYREPMPVYASHALKVLDQSGTVGETERRTGRRIIGLIFVALLVGYVVSLTSNLWTHYTYSYTLDIAAIHPINDYGIRTNPRSQILDPGIQYSRGVYYPNHHVWGHTAFGFGFTALLSWLKLQFPWWPLHPVGYLMIMTFPSAHLWFSIMLGWAIKSLIVRFGGVKLYVAGKPLFLGLIVGESAAAAFWLVVGIVLNAMDVPYRPVNIMPG